MTIEDLWMQVFASNDAGEKYDLLITIARTLIQEGKLEESIRTAEQAGGLFPERMEPFVLVADCYRRGGMPEPAIKTICDAVERATSRGPSLEFRQVCASCFRDLHWNQIAVQAATESLQYFPGDPELLTILKESSWDFYSGDPNA